MRLRLLAAFLALSGCSGETFYKKPEGGAVAWVRFSGSAPDHVFSVTQHASADCDLGRSGGIMGVVGGIGAGAPMPLSNVPPHVRQTGNTERMFGYSEAAGAHSIERAVATDRDFVFTLSRLVDSKIQSGFYTRTMCTITLQFMVRPGEQYEVTYSQPNSSSCRVSVSRLDRRIDGTTRRTPLPSVRQVSPTCSPGAVR